MGLFGKAKKAAKKAAKKVVKKGAKTAKKAKKAVKKGARVGAKAGKVARKGAGAVGKGLRRAELASTGKYTYTGLLRALAEKRRRKAPVRVGRTAASSTSRPPVRRGQTADAILRERRRQARKHR